MFVVHHVICLCVSATVAPAPPQAAMYPPLAPDSDAASTGHVAPLGFEMHSKCRTLYLI